MKKFVIYFLGILFITLSFTNCKSSKNGCGLTSDTQKIEQSTTPNNQTIVTVK